MGDDQSRSACGHRAAPCYLHVQKRPSRQGGRRAALAYHQSKSRWAPDRSLDRRVGIEQPWYGGPVSVSCLSGSGTERPLLAISPVSTVSGSCGLEHGASSGPGVVLASRWMWSWRLDEALVIGHRATLRDVAFHRKLTAPSMANSCSSRQMRCRATLGRISTSLDGVGVTALRRAQVSAEWVSSNPSHMSYVYRSNVLAASRRNGCRATLLTLRC